MRRRRVVSDHHLRRMQLCREGVETNKEWSIIIENAHGHHSVELVSLSSSRIRTRFSVGIRHCESTLSRLMSREERKAADAYLRFSGEPAESLSQVHMCLLLSDFAVPFLQASFKVP